MENPVKLKFENFFSKRRKKEYKKGEVIIQADATPEGLYYIHQGIVRQYAITTKGDEINLNTFKEGALFPMAYILNDTVSKYFFEALSDVTILIVPKKEAQKFIEENTDVLLDLVKRIYRGLDGYFQRIEQMMMGSASQRLITELLIYARRFGIKFGDTSQVTLNLTEKDVAAEAGIARETVSRELKKLAKKGLVNFKNKTFVITDMKKLEAELI